MKRPSNRLEPENESRSAVISNKRVALHCSRFEDGLSGVYAAVNRLVKALLATAQGHIDPVVNELFSDRALPAVQFLERGPD